MDVVFARDLQKDLRARKRRNKAAHEAVLHMLVAKIRSKASSDWQRLVYQVPEFVPSAPAFDVEECAGYLRDKLSMWGYNVELFPPSVLYVSWDPDEANRSQLKS